MKKDIMDNHIMKVQNTWEGDVTTFWTSAEEHQLFSYWNSKEKYWKKRLLKKLK